jgi:hypothetical protein
VHGSAQSGHRPRSRHRLRQYARRFPQHLGSTIRFFVSDHEGAYGASLPYTPALWETFRQRHNYDLRPLLPLLSSDSQRAVKARQDYLETVSHLYAVNYVQQVTDWCSRHNVEHGHSDIEETLLLQVLWTGDMFQLWRASSAIFIDALIERARMPIDFQEAMSVAHFEQRPLMVETHGLLGHDSYFSLEKSRRVSNMAALWGAHRLIAHYFEYDPSRLQYPPSTFLTQPTFQYFHHYSATFHRPVPQCPVRTTPVSPSTTGGERRQCGRAFQESQRPTAVGRSMDDTQEYYSALNSTLRTVQVPHSGQPLSRATLSSGCCNSAAFAASCAMSHIATASLDRIRDSAAGDLCWRRPQPRDHRHPSDRRFPTLPQIPC